MPLYDYHCASCDHTEEHLTNHHDRDKERVCPRCGAPMKRALFSGSTSFVLKGGGWYADGYQKKE